MVALTADDSSGELLRVNFDPFRLSHSATRRRVRSDRVKSPPESAAAAAAEQQVGIRYRGLGAAAITNRTRISSGRFGPTRKLRRHRSARWSLPGADGMYVEHGHADGKSGDLGSCWRGPRGQPTQHRWKCRPCRGDDSVEAAAARRGSSLRHRPPARRHGAHRFAQPASAVIPPLDCMTNIRDRARRSRC